VPTTGGRRSQSYPVPLARLRRSSLERPRLCGLVSSRASGAARSKPRRGMPPRSPLESHPEGVRGAESIGPGGPQRRRTSPARTPGAESGSGAARSFGGHFGVAHGGPRVRWSHHAGSGHFSARRHRCGVLPAPGFAFAADRPSSAIQTGAVAFQPDRPSAVVTPIRRGSGEAGRPRCSSEPMRFTRCRSRASLRAR
jgi:hypothetical protein